MDYFSDREKGPPPRIGEIITPSAWGGIVAIIQALVKSGAFGLKYSQMCDDGHGPVGTDEFQLRLALNAIIPELDWPLRTDLGVGKFLPEPYCPETLVILDFIEFSFHSIGKPIKGDYHKFFGHSHLSFDVIAGQKEFRSEINSIFARNGIAYELSSEGRVERLAPTVMREMLFGAVFNSGDPILDGLLEEARNKFLSPKVNLRREALERLWDSWERLKCLINPTNKKDSIAALINRAASNTEFQEELNKEARELTDIGNKFHIRHSEPSQVPLESPAHMDYLFHRLFCLIWLLLTHARQTDS